METLYTRPYRVWIHVYRDGEILFKINQTEVQQPIEGRPAISMPNTNELRKKICEKFKDINGQEVDFELHDEHAKALYLPQVSALTGRKEDERKQELAHVISAAFNLRKTEVNLDLVDRNPAVELKYKSSNGIQWIRESERICLLDFSRLKPSTWINDSIINFYRIKLLQAFSRTTMRPVALLSTQLWNHIKKENHEAAFKFVESRTEKLKKNFWSYQSFALPFWIGDHWSLIIINLPNSFEDHQDFLASSNYQQTFKQKLSTESGDTVDAEKVEQKANIPFIANVDSSGYDNREPVKLAQRFFEFYANKIQNEAMVQSVSNLKILVPGRRVPQQDDADSCGLFVCHFMRELISNKEVFCTALIQAAAGQEAHFRPVNASRLRAEIQQEVEQLVDEQLGQQWTFTTKGSSWARKRKENEETSSITSRKRQRT